MNNLTISDIGSWASIIALIIYIIVNLLAYLKKSKNKRHKFSLLIEEMVSKSTTLTKRQDIAVYLQTWNQQWQFYLIREYIFLATVIIFSAVFFIYLIQISDSFYKNSGVSVLAVMILSQSFTTFRVKQMANLFTETFLNSWETHLKKHLPDE